MEQPLGPDARRLAGVPWAAWLAWHDHDEIDVGHSIDGIRASEASHRVYRAPGLATPEVRSDEEGAQPVAKPPHRAQGSAAGAQYEPSQGVRQRVTRGRHGVL